MAETDDLASSLSEEEMKALADWKQGDFTLDRVLFPVISETSDDDLGVDFAETHGWAVISQTCDIVNFGPGKDYVTICPLVEAGNILLGQIRNGSTPAAAAIELADRETIVVDFGRTASLHKRALVPLTRRDGFKDDFKRSEFGQVLERRFGRFAFPDWLSTGPLKQIRDRARDKHGSNADLGLIYKAIDQFRVRGNPDLESPNAVIGFHVVVNGEKEKLTTRKAIRDELMSVAKKFNWPEQYQKEDEFFTIQTLEEMSAKEWTDSHAVDLDFISNSR